MSDAGRRDPRRGRAENRQALLRTVLAAVAAALLVAACVTFVSRNTSTAAAKQMPQHVVLFGDSVPAGTACDCPGFGADVAATLSAQLSNFSIAGFTSGELVTQLRAAPVEEGLRTATVVILTIGANDFNEFDANAPACSDLECFAASRRTVTANLHAILTRIKSVAPTSSLVIVTGYWNIFRDGQVGAIQGPTYVATSDHLTRTFNSDLVQLSKSHGALYADLYKPFRGDGHLDDTGLLASDGYHPNADGHRLIAQAIRATFRTARPMARPQP
jgi:lysophospholipase L1-like esterase